MTLDKFVFRSLTGALLLICFFTLGCSQNVKVSGTVTYSDTGEPVKFGTVIFNSENLVGRGAINNGKYSVGRINDGDGIPRGTYTISADTPYIPPQNFVMVGLDGKPVQSGTPTHERELFYTKEPQTIEIKKSMTYNFSVERGSPLLGN